MYSMIIYLLVFIVQLSQSKVESESVDSILSDKYDSYGDDWIFMPDGNNNLQVAVLKGEPLEPRGYFGDIANFFLYTRAHGDVGLAMFTNDPTSIENSDYSAKRPSKFITHGWRSSGNSPSLIKLKDAYLVVGDYNIFICDWEALAASTFYLGPMKDTSKVGSAIAAFIDNLLNLTSSNPQEMHLIGHSLGAHVMGKAAASVTRGKIGRVSGLDPAWPGFQGIMAVESQLNKNCASFVDITHTCGGVLGFLNPLGHVDFYPNGGTPVQRGCCCISEMMEACSHGRAWELYTESVNSEKGFLSTECNSWNAYVSGYCQNSSIAFFGEFVDRNARGSYYFKTKSKSPYAMGHGN